jgi:hypothetical protein
MTDTIELQGCERCGKEADLETMTRMEDGWMCQPCDGAFRKAFDACRHTWSPHTDQMGDEGQYCENCSGFVRDEDFPAMFPTIPTVSDGERDAN